MSKRTKTLLLALIVLALLVGLFFCCETAAAARG